MNANDPRDWKSDPITGELAIENGDLVLSSGLESVRQDLSDRLSLVRGEWFLDPTAGIPLFDSVLVKSPDVALVASLYRKAILGTEGVRSITSFVMTFDRRARSASIVFSADTDLGPIVNATIGVAIPAGVMISSDGGSVFVTESGSYVVTLSGG